MTDSVFVSRVLQFCGLALAITGLAGFWLTRGESPVPLTNAQRQLLGVDEDDFHTSFVIAGRDIFYGAGETEPVYNEEGEITCWRNTGVQSSFGVNTDTVIYASLTNNELTLIALPRDLFVGPGPEKINGVYARGGAQRLERSVSGILGVPVDFHLIINIEVFQRIVDALGGVEVNVPVRMYHYDCTANLTIDLQPGLQHLNGLEASHFVRYRNLFRGDIDRIENVKTLAYAMLARLKELHVGGITRLPELVRTYFDEVETNADLLRLAGQLLPRLNNLEIKVAGTLPAVEATRAGGKGTSIEGVEVDPSTVEQFLASTFGGSTRRLTEPPGASVLITNRSGIVGLEDWYKARLIAIGIPENLLRTRVSENIPSTPRVLATVRTWKESEYYSSLLHLGRQQVDRFPTHLSEFGIEIVLGHGSYAGLPQLMLDSRPN